MASLTITLDGYDNGTSWTDSSTIVLAGNNRGGASATLGPAKRVWSLGFSGTADIIFAPLTMVFSITDVLPFTAWGSSRMPKDEADLVEIGRVTFNSSGSGQSFTIQPVTDVAKIADVLEDEKYDGKLGIVISQTGGAWANLTNGQIKLDYEAVDYFTGLKGIHRSRPWSQPSGTASSARSRMPDFGQTIGRLVHPDWYEPEDPGRNVPPDPGRSNPEDDLWVT